MSTEEKKPVVTADDDEFADFEDNDIEETAKPEKAKSEVKKGSYAGIHAAGFRDLMLKEQLLNAISTHGFEHPSQVQQTAIPQAILGHDVICQAKAGMGKTAVFVLATLQQIQPESENGINVIDTLVLANTRELAGQITAEFARFSVHLPDVQTMVVYGGIPLKEHQRMLKEESPHIVVGCPGRVKALVESGHMQVDKVKRFILDECDHMLDSVDMRRDVQKIFKATPYEKQVMMFSATLGKDTRKICRKFTQNPQEILIDDEKKLVLHGLQQYYVKLKENEKNRKLTDLLDQLRFNQIIIFVKSTSRCKTLNKLLRECAFPSMAMMGRMDQKERQDRYNKFKEGKSRILVSTDIFGRGVDFERVNIVINYDMVEKENDDQYLHRVGRSGRFGTKGLAISFISSQDDSETLEKIQTRCEVEINSLPDEIDPATYMTS